MRREKNAATEKTEQLVGARRDASVEPGGEIMNMAISKLTFSANTWPLKRWGLTIEEEKNSVICEIRDERKVKTAHSVNLVDNWAKLQDLLAKCNFSAWREKYEEPVLDGTFWNLEIQYADGQTMKSEGMNGYPDEWKAFMTMCDYCADIAGFETDEGQ
ncbi:MAG: hypothetical protein IKB22_06575 [Lentisphaeria bacterium]|nr:hypothetical protein [Lentisphaeria bacterium]